MRRDFMVVKLMGVVLATSLLIAGCGSNNPPTPGFNFTPQPDNGEPSTEQESEVVATVNGTPISSDAFQRELARFEAGQVALGYQVRDEAGYRQQILDLLIEQELIRQYAVSQGVTVDDATVDAEIQQMIADTGQDYFEGWLAGNFYSMEEFRELVRLDLVTKQLLVPVVDTVPTTAEHVHARHILVNSESEALEVLTRLTAGEDFAALAGEYSVDVTSRDQGGDLGWFPRGGLLVPEVEEVAFALAPGETSDVVQTGWGFHIIQTLEFDPAREIVFETRQRLIEHTIEEWRLSLRDGADIQQLISVSS